MENCGAKTVGNGLDRSEKEQNMGRNEKVIIEHEAEHYERKTGKEPIVSPRGEEIATLNDFWSWAYSDLLQNAERGVLAEFLVAKALNIEDEERISWGKYDLLLKEKERNIAIEVKTSAYLQTWKQSGEAKLIFGIQPTRGWNNETNTHDFEIKRQADMYVFCVHKHTDIKTANPLDLSQWDFYLLPTFVLNEKLGNNKTASLGKLLEIGAEICPYEELHKRIVELISGGPK